MSTPLTSLIVEFDVVGRVNRLSVPVDGGGTTAHPNEPPLLLDEVANPPGDDDANDGGVLVLLTGVVVQVTDLVRLDPPTILEGDSISGVLDESLDGWLRPQLVSDRDQRDHWGLEVPVSPELVLRDLDLLVIDKINNKLTAVVVTGDDNELPPLDPWSEDSRRLTMFVQRFIELEDHLLQS